MDEKHIDEKAETSMVRKNTLAEKTWMKTHRRKNTNFDGWEKYMGRKSQKLRWLKNSRKKSHKNAIIFGNSTVHEKNP